MRETDAAPRGAAETSPTIRDVAVYLLGEGPLLGFWYHEQPPNEPPYWWRRHLRAALAASSPPGGQAPECVLCSTVTPVANLCSEHRQMLLARSADVKAGRYIPHEQVVAAAGQTPDAQEREKWEEQDRKTTKLYGHNKRRLCPVDAVDICDGCEFYYIARRAHDMVDGLRGRLKLARSQVEELTGDLLAAADGRRKRIERFDAELSRLRSQLEAARKLILNAAELRALAKYVEGDDDFLRALDWAERAAIAAGGTQHLLGAVEKLRAMKSRAAEREEDGHAS